VFDFLESWRGMVSFAEVTEQNIQKMDDYLAERGLKVSSRYNYHKILKFFVRQAFNDGLIAKNPYVTMKIDRGEEDGLYRHLTPAEFHRFEKCTIDSEHLERVRDLFVFQTYTCMAYTDLCDFDVSQVKDGIYTGNRGKTGKEFSFLLMEPALAILAKYNNTLPIISNVKYNQYLKDVAHIAGIDKSVTCHWARHTGATILLNEGGVDMEVIAKVLGDTVEQVRRTYAKLLDKTVAHAMSKAQEKLR
jgi:site-specific recombinase XerD